MNLSGHLKKLVTGFSIHQEYVCLASPELSHPMSILASSGESTPQHDVTNSHVFLCYKPFIIGLINRSEETALREEVRWLHFVQHDTQISVGLPEMDAKPGIIARIQLQKTGSKIFADYSLDFYTGVHGEHIFINGAHQWINRLWGRVKGKPPGNVDLPGNLYEQVRIAYALPRIISIISVSDGTRVNMFPTDLHGAIGDTKYVGSLRKGGLANKQVEQYKKIVISDVDPQWFREAYAMGKNHMRELRPVENFSTHQEVSLQFSLPLPKGVIRYRELHLTDSSDIGMYRIHLYKVISARTMVPGPPLTHVHRYYVQWRLDQGYRTPCLFR